MFLVAAFGRRLFCVCVALYHMSMMANGRACILSMVWVRISGEVDFALDVMESRNYASACLTACKVCPSLSARTLSMLILNWGT